MSDLERADAWIDFWPVDPFVNDGAEARRSLAAEFAAVRLEERKAIVAWLRGRTSVPFSTHEQRDVGSIYAASLLGEADRIERGEHEEHVS